MTATETTKETTVATLKPSKEIYSTVKKEFYNLYLIQDKKMSHWDQYFSVSISEDASPGELKAVAANIYKKYEEASKYKAQAESVLHGLKKINERQYIQAYTDQIKEYKQAGNKVPAKDTLHNLAEIQLGTQREAEAHAEVEILFWKSILDRLTNARKIIENMSLNTSVEAKFFSNGGDPTDDTHNNQF